jgi:hypothetical protein
MDKEVDSRKVENHMFHARREESSIFGRHQHHSPRHLVGREGSSLSLPHIKQHKRRIGVNVIWIL